MNENLIEALQKIYADIKKYIDIKLDISKLEAAEKLGIMSTFIILIFVILFFASCLLLFLSFTAAFFLSNIFENFLYGFITVAGIYFLLLILLILFRKALIKKPILKFFLRKLFK